jgi:hypothetical protein
VISWSKRPERAGSVISGNLYVDTLLAVPPYDETTGDETAVLAYIYTIG